MLEALLLPSALIGTELQVLLGDLPANVSSKRLGDGVLRSALTNLGLVITATAATVAAELTHRLPGVLATSEHILSSCS